MWRWLGYGAGLDLLMNYFAGTLRITRNCTAIPTHQHMSVKLCDEIRIHYRVLVTSESGVVLLDTQKCTGLLRVDKVNGSSQQ